MFPSLILLFATTFCTIILRLVPVQKMPAQLQPLPALFTTATLAAAGGIYRELPTEQVWVLVAQAFAIGGPAAIGLWHMAKRLLPFVRRQKSGA